jgi:arabinofuranosyltransferase
MRPAFFERLLFLFNITQDELQTERSRAQWWIIVGGLVIGLVVVRIIATHVLFLYDDALITFRYARNILAGEGMVSNVGERIYGLTTPLFGLIITVVMAMHLLPEVMINVINIASDVAILLITMWLLLAKWKDRSETKSDVTATAIYSGAAIFGLLFILSPVLNRICSGGMEADLTLAVMLTSLVAYHRKKFVLAIVIAAITYFFRPEAVILVLAFCIHTWMERGFKQSVKLGLIALAVVLPGVLYLYSYYGSVLPQSMLAKAARGQNPLSIVIEELILSDPQSWAMIPFTLYGGWLAWKRGGILRIIVIWMTIFVTSYFISRPGVFKWYGEPVHVTQCLFSALAIGNLLRMASEKWRSVRSVTKSVWTIPVFSLLIVMAWAAIFAKRGESGTNKFIFPAFQQWVKQYDLDHKRIFTGDLGAIGYYAPHSYVIDQWGLICPAALTYDPPIKMLHDYKPDYVLIQLHAWEVQELTENHIMEEYEPLRRITSDGDTSLNFSMDSSIYRNGPTDYFLMRRREPIAGSSQPSR